MIIYVYLYTYIDMLIYIGSEVYTRMYKSMIHMNIQMYTYICICTYICIYIYIHIHIFVYVCIYTFMHICIYI